MLPTTLNLGKVILSKQYAQIMFYPTLPSSWWRIKEGVPPNAEFRGQAFDTESNCFIFYFEHPSFPPVEEGEPINHEIPVIMENLLEKEMTPDVACKSC